MKKPDTKRTRIGIILPLGEWRMVGQTARWADLLAMAQRAEELGFDSIWIVDHLLVRAPGEPDVGVWEGWSVLSAVAAVTRRVEIGTLVACASFRNPALLAKMADTVDEISGGRLVLGLGAGHHEPEYRAFGFPFDHRVGRFEEALQIIHGLLRDGYVDFDGTYYQARDCVLRPRGPRLQGPPIIIATTGPRMLRLAARFADSWNVYFDKTGNRLENLLTLLQNVDTACAETGRDPRTLERTASVLVALDDRVRIEGVTVPPLTGSIDHITGELLGYVRAGISHIQIRVEPNTVASIDALAPVLDRIRHS
jgi:probable F420-dependent oxidoreductase